MSTALVSQYYNVEDVIRQNIKNNQLKQQQHQSVERRNTIGGPVNMQQQQRNRNYSLSTTFNQVTVNTHTQQTCMISMDNQSVAAARDHRRLDRSYSEPCDTTMNNTDLNMNLDDDDQNQKNATVNSSRYKTELCRPFEESGNCKYADKCQFAHGAHELRSLSRHPKYKTELCRTFHSKGFCPYGPRCNFVHNEDLKRLNQMVQNNKFVAAATQPTQQQIATPNLSQSPPPMMVQRPASINFNSSFNGSLGSTADSSPPSSVGSESPSLSPVFFGEDIPQMMNPCNSLPVVPSPINYNSTSDVFRNVAHFNETGTPDLQPLNIQTHLNSDLGLLEQQFMNMYMNLNNQSHFNDNTTPVFGEWDPTLIGAPLSSPDSISGESIGSSSTSSVSSSNVNQHSVCGSPVEVGKNFRLPVFNHIAQDNL